MEYNLIECLSFINPTDLDYTQWTMVGMALKEEGYTAADWDAWSAADSRRYHRGECEKKWETFNGAATPVTGATIVQLAKENGMRFYVDEALDWDSEIGRDSKVFVDKAWVEEQEIAEPKSWHPAQQIITYLQTLFEANENVGYVTECWQNEEGKFLPSKGSYTRTAGELIEKLSKCGDDIGAVLGDYKPEAGAWVRFNPLDGAGVKNDNVTDYRYALVESDTMNLAKQNAILRELELPIAVLIYSGGKSVHAIVRIEAADYQEYRKRVDYLYEICSKNGLEIDRQNKNPSRLSRLPGVTRGKKKQFIIDTNIGKASWKEWQEWVESINDNLPEPESIADVWDNLPELSPPLIDGVLRQGHKMLLAGPSKAGKSYALIELCCALAEGREWLGFNCTKGKLLYVNLELDRPSCLHRFKDVYSALGWKPQNLKNIDIWNLRGKSIPMDKLAPKLIRRAAKKGYIAVIIDPIYKVITGDENSADQMAHFCNQFDKVCNELGCAVIYCHHHSKGSQGGKQSMDRASGSGVFARDPDALLDLIELPLTEAMREQQAEKATCALCMQWLKRFHKEDEASQDDMCSDKAMLSICSHNLSRDTMDRLLEANQLVRAQAFKKSAWRIEGTLREFQRFEPIDLWFDFPVHIADADKILKDVSLESPKNKWQSSRKSKAESETKEPIDKAAERKRALEIAYESYIFEHGNVEVKIKKLVESSGIKESTLYRYIEEHPEFERKNGVVTRK